MRARLGKLSLVPNGLVAESVSSVGETMIVTARAKVGEASCPLCGEMSRRVHSRYVRYVRDLPCSGQGVRLCLTTRRFSCERPECPGRIFAERFAETVLPARARRTSRLEHIVHHLGLALGGRPAASLAKRLMLPVSTTRCFASCDGEPMREPKNSRLPASMIGLFVETIAMARLSAIWRAKDRGAAS
jgi:zinc-finger of transposase IS204/IS1001/IS1096/IS1165